MVQVDPTARGSTQRRQRVEAFDGRRCLSRLPAMPRSRFAMAASLPARESSLAVPAEELPLGPRTGILGKKWTLLVLRTIASSEAASFSELLDNHRRLSGRLLSLRLSELQREGFIEKVRRDVHQRRGRYRLTAKGRDALPVLEAFSRLVREYGEGVNIVPGAPSRGKELCLEHPDFPKRPIVRGIARGRPSWDRTSAQGPRHLLKDQCEKCKLDLSTAEEAWVCSYECTWCPGCAEGFHWRCPNCQGALRRREIHPAPRGGLDHRN